MKRLIVGIAVFAALCLLPASTMARVQGNLIDNNNYVKRSSPAVNTYKIVPVHHVRHHRAVPRRYYRGRHYRGYRYGPHRHWKYRRYYRGPSFYFAVGPRYSRGFYGYYGYTPYPFYRWHYRPHYYGYRNYYYRYRNRW